MKFLYADHYEIADCRSTNSAEEILIIMLIGLFKVRSNRQKPLYGALCLILYLKSSRHTVVFNCSSQTSSKN